MAVDERTELMELSKDGVLDVFEGGLFELVTEGKQYPELLEMTLAVALRRFVNDKLADRSKEELVDLFLDSEQAVVELVDYAAELGLLDED